VECKAINEVFGNLTKKLYISSIKSMLGHTMGAASAIEAIACCLAIKNNTIPPTINYETPDPECDINCVPNKSVNKKIRVVLNNSFAFGGNNACVAFKGI
jgi:3-oxoacyl-[acyl-carrier-protein] synthase II